MCNRCRSDPQNPETTTTSIMWFKLMWVHTQQVCTDINCKNFRLSDEKNPFSLISASQTALLGLRVRNFAEWPSLRSIRTTLAHTSALCPNAGRAMCNRSDRSIAQILLPWSHVKNFYLETMEGGSLHLHDSRPSCSSSSSVIFLHTLRRSHCHLLNLFFTAVGQGSLLGLDVHLDDI